MPLHAACVLLKFFRSPFIPNAVVELGDDISPCQNRDTRTLIIANHQSTADVPLLMATFSAKPDILPNIMWIMDRVFKFTNFGIVSVIHQDFFVRAVSESYSSKYHAIDVYSLNLCFVFFSLFHLCRARKTVRQPWNDCAITYVIRSYRALAIGWFYSQKVDSCENVVRSASAMARNMVCHF